MKKLLPLLALLSTCTPPADTPMGKMIPTVDNRVSITRIAVFEDGLVGVRGAYITKDRETGREFIGISGIGISELGSYSARKTSHLDER
jgi:hypothetical protein